MEATDLRLLGLRQKLVGEVNRDDDGGYPSFFTTTPTTAAPTGFDDNDNNKGTAMHRKSAKRLVDENNGTGGDSPSTPLPAKLSPLSLPKRLSPTLPPIFEKRLLHQINGLGITNLKNGASSSDGDQADNDDDDDDDEDEPLSSKTVHQPVVGLGISSAANAKKHKASQKNRPPSLIVCLKIPESRRQDVSRVSKKMKRSHTQQHPPPPAPTSNSSSLSSEDTGPNNNDRNAITPASTPPDTIGGVGVVAGAANSTGSLHKQPNPGNNKVDEMLLSLPGSREWTPSPPGSPNSHSKNDININNKKDQTSRQIPPTPSRGKTRVITPSSPDRVKHTVPQTKSIKKLPPQQQGGKSNDPQQHRPDIILHRKFSHWSELARTRKHMADDAFRNKDYRLGLVCGVDTVICYVMSFDYEDKFQQFTEPRGTIDCRSWLSLRPYMSFLIGAAQDSGNLVIAGLLHQMRAVIYQRISQHCKDSIGKLLMQHRNQDGKDRDLEKFTSSLIDLTNNLTKALDYTRIEWLRSSKLLTPEGFAQTFPHTFAKRDNTTTSNTYNNPITSNNNNNNNNDGGGHEPSKSLRPSQDRFSLPLHSYSTITDASAVGYNALKEWAGNLEYSWAVESVK